jgi:hypothetical protein
MKASSRGRFCDLVSVSAPALMLMILASGGLSAQTTAPAAAAGDVTFTKDVAPILQRSCQECHRPNAIAPMSLLTYQEARPWAKAIKERVASRMMPPWYVDVLLFGLPLDFGVRLSRGGFCATVFVRRLKLCGW